MLSAADSACYAAKDQGRNRVHIYHEDDEDLARRYGEMQWVTRINRALEEERFELWTQAIMPLSEDRVPSRHAPITSFSCVCGRGGPAHSARCISPRRGALSARAANRSLGRATALRWLTRKPENPASPGNGR